MKKIFMFSIVLMGALVFNNNVKAACASGVYVDNELLCLVSGSTSSNKAGTAYVESSTLVLENYNGGNIKFFSGLGNPIKVEIKLIGDNYITSENNYGILSFVTGINFVGNGTLTIKSKMPFVSTDADRQAASYFLENNEVSTIKIVVGKENEGTKPSDNNAEIKDATTNNDGSVKENNDLLIVALIICLFTSFVCIVAVINNNNKIKKIRN